MAKCHQETCPGCSRHCTAQNPHCKYGRSYFEKVQKQQQPAACVKRCKWEKLVEQGGVAWKLLWASRCCKKALRKETITEKSLLAALDASEQAQLTTLLDKLTRALG